MSDYDFWDEGFDDMIKEQRKNSSSSASKDDRFPISYFGEAGTYIFRLYPEKYNGKPRIIREVWSNQLHNYRRVLTKKGDNRIDDLVKEAQDKKLDNNNIKLWRHKKSQDGIMMGYIISAPEGKYIQPAGNASAIVMNWRQLQALDSFFKSIEAEGASLRKFLHPGKPSNAIKMTIDKVQKGKKTETIINVSATTTADYELPPMESVLPEGIEFKGLDDIHVKADAYLTDELYAEFKKYYDEKIEEVLKFRGQATHNPKDSSTEEGYVPEFDDEEFAEAMK